MGITNNGPLLTPALGSTQTTFEDVALEGTQGVHRARASEATPEFTPSAAGSAQHKDALKDLNGAPALERPKLPFEPEDLIAALQNLRNQSLSGQEANAKGRLEKSRIDSKKANENQQVKLKEWAADCEKAAKAEKRSKIFGWIGKIVAVVAAVAAVIATVATAGAASPLLLAVACIGLASAGLAVVDQAVKDLGISDKGFSIGLVLSKPLEWILLATGVDKEKAAQIAMLAGGAVGTLALGGLPLLVEPQLLGEMSKSICDLAGASDKTTMWVTMSVGLTATVTVGILMAVVAWKLPPAESMSKIANVFTGSGTQMLQGSTQIAQGSNTIASAIYEANASEKMADKQLLDAFLVQCQRAMEMSMDDLRKVIQQLQEAVESVSTMINSFGESTTLITRNLSKSSV